MRARTRSHAHASKRRSQFEFVGDFGGNVFETDGCAADALETYAVEAESGELTNFHLPLNQRVRVGVSVHAQEEKSLPLLVVAIVGVQNASNLEHHFVWIFVRSSFHAPSEPK